MSFPPFRVMEAAESLCLCSCHIQILPQEHGDRNHARARPACAVDLHHLWPDISPMFLLISTLDSQPAGRSLNPSLSQFRGLWDTPKGTSVARHCPHFSGACYNPRAFRPSMHWRCIMMQHVSYEVHHLQRCTQKLSAHGFLRGCMLCRRRAISLKHFQ